ncbi:phosphoribosylglycinamide formyltransferase [Mycobacterium uberis]|uniref:Phosphoribosylglycinamide formyltransferase n=1 Tax=Mycobacterium uberis TaxID=2162698 RepID=A0A3E1HH63_9MYCO|nr:phosphoribosylglycinamide formyltransferase [Mycobacterium uberis]RFD25790.1 phosphoribosylglycinamide formyltransferase [Mycobacterium uberis]
MTKRPRLRVSCIIAERETGFTFGQAFARTKSGSLAFLRSLVRQQEKPDYARGVQPLCVPPSAPARVVVLASGTGSLLGSLIDAAVGDYPARVVAVGVDRDCRAAEIAKAASVPTFTVLLADHSGRDAWDAAITEAVAEHTPDLVVSAGFMKVLGQQFISRFIGRIINTHPALLPAFPGAHGVADALAYGVKVTGATVHLVDAGIDTGPILAQQSVPVLDGDDIATLHERIKVTERRLLVDVVAAIATGGMNLVDGKATIGRKATIG